MASIPPPMPVGYNAPQPPGQVPPAFANMMAQRYMRRFPQTGGPQVPAVGGGAAPMGGVDPNDPRVKLAAAIKARQAAGLQPQGAMPAAAGPMPPGGGMPGGGF